MKKVYIFVILIIFLGGALRFWDLGQINLGFFRDEAALGFNAWSILQTGADEYGQKFPIFFRSFEVFFMPLYVYLSIPIIAILGLSEFSTRLLSAFSGTLLIFITFLIGRRLFSSDLVGIISSAIIAFSPWSIFYSRGAFEGNLALVFFAAAFYFWLEFSNKGKKIFFFISIFLFIFSMYSYQAPRLVAPLFVAIALLSQKGWVKNLKLWICGLILALVLYLPIIFLSTQAASYHRAFGVSIFSSTDQIPGFSTNLGDWQKLYLIPREFLSLYLQYFSPYNLFWEGDYNRQRNVDGFSVFYVWQFPFLVLGLWFFIKNKYSNKKLLLFWLLLASIPAALTKDPFHTYRSILFFLPISFLIAFGVYKMINFKRLYLLITGGVSILIAISITAYFFSLGSTTPSLYWRDWDFGYKQITEVLKTEPSNSQIIIDDPDTESYIHFLFHKLIYISDYQNEAQQMITSNYSSSTTKLRPKKIGRFEFRKIDFPNERGHKNTIFVLSSKVIEPIHFKDDPKLVLVREIKAPNGKTAFYIIKVL